MQFYIDGYDDVLGMDFDNGQNQEGFRVIFHEQVTQDEAQLIQDFSFIEIDDEELYFPVEREMALSFTTGVEPMSIDDFRSNDKYASILTALENDEALEDSFYDTMTGDGHKIGGIHSLRKRILELMEIIKIQSLCCYRLIVSATIFFGAIVALAISLSQRKS